jgi:hypothetical protein
MGEEILSCIIYYYIISAANNTLWAHKNSIPGGGGPNFRESYAAWGVVGQQQVGRKAC